MHPAEGRSFFVCRTAILCGKDLSMSDNRAGDLQALYQQAFRDFGSVALWNMRPTQKPTPADALAITAALRTYGSMDGRRLAERIETLCRATH